LRGPLVPSVQKSMREHRQALPSRPFGTSTPCTMDITWLEVPSIVGPAHVGLKDTFEVFACIGDPGFQRELLLAVQLNLSFPCAGRPLFRQLVGVDLFEGLQVTGENPNAVPLVRVLEYPA